MRRSGPPSTRSRYQNPTTLPGLRAQLMCPPSLNGCGYRSAGDTQRADGKFRGASSEPGCSRDQKQPCAEGDGPGGSRDALTGRGKTFDGDRGRDDSHRENVHDPDDQEDGHQTDTALAAVEAEAQAVLPGGTVALARGCLPAAGEMTCLPSGELEEAGQ